MHFSLPQLFVFLFNVLNAVLLLLLFFLFVLFYSITVYDRG